MSEHIDISTTRSGNHVLTFFEDSHGLLWCGTMAGLLRYDGFNIKKYPYADNEEIEIIINSVTEDAKGNIWCSSLVHGIMVLPIEKYGFGRLTIPNFSPALPKAATIAFDKKGDLWGISQAGSLFSINMADSSLITWPATTTGNISFLEFTENGSLWFSGERGAFFIQNPGAGMLQPLQMVFARRLMLCTLDGEDAYVYSKDSIYRLANNDKDGFTISPVIPISSICKNKKTAVFTHATTNNLTQFIVSVVFNRPLILVDKTTGQAAEYTFDGNSTPKCEVHSCYFSSAGHLYIGTNKGFFRISLGNKAFTTYSEPDTKFRCAISKGNDTLLFGTSVSGILCYIKQPDGQWVKDNYYNSQKVLTASINQFFKDDSGRLWATTNAGLCYEGNNAWNYVFKKSNFWGITQDDKGTLWMGTNGFGLVRYDPATYAYEEYLPVKDGKTGTEKNYNRIWKVKYYKGKIYLGTAAGLMDFDPKNGTFNYSFDGKFKDVPVWDFFISDSLWVIPTQGRGLWLYKPQSASFERIETVHSFQYSLLQSATGAFWVIDDKGIMMCRLPDMRPLGFTAFNGLNTDYFSFTGIAALGKDKVVFCGEDGFTIVDETLAIKELEKKTKPNLFISGLKYSGISIADFLPDGATVELEYGKGQLLMEWAATHFLPGNYKIHYRLDGVDDGWNTATGDNTVNYTNLNPGKYVFNAYLTAPNETGVKTSYKLHVHIIPPFWLTLWFNILVIIIFAGLLFYIIYNWIMRQKLKHSQLKSEIEALRAQINPHFIFNALNSIQAFIYSESKSEANEYLSKFARLMRKILENSREEIITLSQEQAFLQLYLEMESLRFKGNLTYEIAVQTMQPETFKIPSMLVQPLVENALKHGVKTEYDRLHIKINFKEDKNILICEVMDNGKGFTSNSEEGGEKKSLGLKLVKERLVTLSKIYRKEYRAVIHSNIVGETGANVTLIIPQHD